ncbi:MAG: ATP-binding cassette domain-containing protein [Chloroflexi bacterium]|nr:ATP-binding cassette domain-containing protein [Chloroflexota bacterium]
MIEVEGVSFAYPGGPPVLADFSLSVAKGSFVSLLGRNGSGKSTLAKLLNGLLLPQRGRVKIDGLHTNSRSHVRDIRRRVQLVFQNPENQLVGVTVEEDIAFGLENLGIPQPEMGERMDWVLDFTRLLPLRSRLVAGLSGGEKQRLALAGVLAMRPRCVVLDEATSMLDEEGRGDLLRLVHAMNKELGVTVVQITQEPEEVRQSDTILVLEGGQIALEGTPSNVLASPEGLAYFGLFDESGAGESIANRRIADSSTSSCPLPPSADAPSALLISNHSGGGSSAGIATNRASNCLSERIHINSPQIELDNVSFCYNRGRTDEAWALVGVQARVRRGQTLAILGRQGSGKSTLLQLLDGLLKPDSGRVLVDGRPMTPERAAELRAEVAMVFQYPEHQLFAATVFDDMAFAARQRSLGEVEVAQRVRDAAALVGLDIDKLAKRRPLELSGGERRKVAIAGALVASPSLLLMDEPMSGLDPLARREFVATIRRLRLEADMGVVVVTHSLAEAMAVADRVMVLEQGTVVLDSSPDELSQWLVAGGQSAGVRRWGSLSDPAATDLCPRTPDPKPLTPNPQPLLLGQMVPGNSLLHSLDPRAKFLASLVLTAGFFLAGTYPPLLALSLVTALLCASSRLSLRSVIGSLRPILLTVVGASVLHLFASPGPYLVALGPVKISQAGLAEAGMVDLRLASFVVIAALMSWTTSPTALAEGLERLLSPLNRLKVPVGDLAMMVGIALRFVPTLVTEMQRLMKAQRARGVDFSQGSLPRRLRKLAPLVIPLIVSTMERGEELAVAMESRCYDGRRRSRFYRLQLTGMDAGVVLGSVGLVTGLLWFLH